MHGQQTTDLAERLRRSEQKVTELEMKNKQIAEDLDRFVILLDCALLRILCITCIHVCNINHAPCVQGER